MTSNLRHLPHAALAPYGVRAVAPGDFLIELLDRDAERMVQVLEQQAAAYFKPTMTIAELLARLAEVAPSLPARYRDHRR